MNTVFVEDGSDFDIGDELLKFLVTGGVLSESSASNISTKAEILSESAKINTDPTKFILRGLGNEIEVRFADFWSVYNDIQKYQTNESILVALGYKFNTIDPLTNEAYSKHSTKNAKKQVLYMAKHFSEYYGKNYYIPSPSDRISILSNQLGYKKLEDVPTAMGVDGKLGIDLDIAVEMRAEDKGFQSDDELKMISFGDSSPTKDDIIFGTAGKDTSRSGTIIKKINDQEIFNGVLYTNISKIPKSSLFNWTKLWKKDVVGLDPDKEWLFGRKWKKIFILGYQVSDKFFYEIWFNTIDSTFSVHDSRGAQMGRKAPTMFEAIRQLFQQLAKVGLSDGEFLRSGIDKSMFDSFTRAVTGEIDTHMKDMLDREQRDIDRAQADVDKKLEQKQKFKDSIKKSVMAARDVTWKAVADTAEFAVDQATQGDDRMSQIKSERAAIEQREAERAAKRQEQLKQQTFDSIDTDAEFVYDEATKTYVKKIIKLSREKGVAAKGTGLRESFGDTDLSHEVDMREIIKQQTDTTQYLGNVERLRTDAKRDSANFKMIQNAVMGSIEKYDETRAETSHLRNILSFLDKRQFVSPTTKPSVFNRIKMFIAGTMYRADFIVGFSINDRVNLEIWYVTEPNPEYVAGGNMGKTISSFYLYDVTSGKIIRKYIPYYRNAEQLVIQKIGVGNI